MRISTGYQYDAFQNNVSAAQSRVFETQQQITTGKRINTPSDDPFGTVTSLNMRKLRTDTGQYGKNLTVAKNFLSYSETTLTDMTNLLSRSYQLALQGANGATDQNGREAMVNEINQIQSRLVDLANSQGPSGEYLFAGQKNDTPPFSASAGVITFSGDTNDRIVETGPAQTMVISLPMSTTLTNAYDQLEQLKSHLQGGNAGAISDLDISAIQTTMKDVTAARGTIGVRLQTIDNLTTQFQNRQDQLTSSIADVEEVDMAKVLTEYQSAQAAYQAALTVAGQGFRLSLMDFLR